MRNFNNARQRKGKNRLIFMNNVVKRERNCMRSIKHSYEGADCALRRDVLVGFGDESS